jgi:two-component system KDP operon response regulator KdpE
MVTILCADHDPYLTKLLEYALQREGFNPLLAHTGRETLRVARAEKVDLFLLDFAMSDLPGLKVLARLRSFSRAPVIMLAPGPDEEDALASFQLEADDYVVKPFNVQVLMKRIGALLRRSANLTRTPLNHRTVYRRRDFIFDPAASELAGHGMRVKLTPTECQILRLLFLHVGRVLSEEQILDAIRSCDNASHISVVKTHISHLRQKLSNLPHGPQLICTIPRNGYTLQRGDERSQMPAEGLSQESAS